LIYFFYSFLSVLFYGIHFFGKSFKLIKMNSFFSFQMEEILHQKIKRAHQSQLCSGYDWGYI